MPGLHRVATTNYDRAVTSLQREIDGAIAAHRVLEAELQSLTDAQIGQPSCLPGWTRGHVITHIARNADSHRRILLAAESGRVVHQYVDGPTGRSDDIEAGSARTADQFRHDVLTSNALLEQAWGMASETGWAGHGVAVTSADLPCNELPFWRWREATVHHADLGLDYTWHDWPAAYVRNELPRLVMLWASRQPMGMTVLPALALAVPEVHRVAWLLGRADIAGLEPSTIFG